MAVSDRLRAQIRRATARTFSRGSQVEPPPRLPDLGIQATPPYHVSDRAVEEAKSPEALSGWISGGAGPVYDRYQSYSAHQLDPNRIDQIFKTADRGQYLVQYGDLWRELLQRDYQMFSLDRGRRVGITTKRFQVTSADSRDEIANGIRNATEAMTDGIDAFDADGVYSMLSANGPGYSLLEVIYEVGRIRFPWKGKTVSVQTINPRQLRYVLPSHLYFKWDDDAPHLNLGKDGNLPLSVAPHKWIWYRTLGDGIASMRGFLRPAAWLHLMGQTSMVSGAIFLKLFGIPQLAAYINQEKWKDATVKATVEACLQSYGNGIPTVFPDWMRDKIVPEKSVLAGGGVDVHMQWRGFIDACMAKCIQGASLQVESSGSGPGSYAQSQVHENRSYDVAVIDAIGTCETIKAQLFRNWLWLNAETLAGVFGCSPDDLLDCVPNCSRRIDRETTPKERAEILCMFADRGVVGSKNQIRNEYAYDAPADEQDEFRGESVQVPSGAVSASPADASGGIDNPKPEAAPANGANHRPAAPPPETA